MKTIVEQRLIAADDAVYYAIGITTFVIAMITGISGGIYAYKKKRADFIINTSKTKNNSFKLVLKTINNIIKKYA